LAVPSRLAAIERVRENRIQVNFPRLSLGLAVLLGMTALSAGLVPAGPASGQAAAPAAPAANTTPTPGPQRGRRNQSQPGGVETPPPTATPEPPQFDTLDGIWEVELQPVGRRLATYAHINIATTGATISGYLETPVKKVRVPMTGTFDGRLISMTAKMPDGTTATLNGYVEGFADMVGLYRTGEQDAGVAFTAQHRKKMRT
jgi:hypothetical protein